LQSLAELADLCASTDRRVVGVLATGQSCIGFPFGAEHVGASPVGAICLVLKGSVDECFGSYEQSLMRLLATHFARAYGEHRWAAAVRLVTTRLREISGLGMLDPEGESADCASELDGREDIELASPIVMEVLDDIAKLSGAMSVTCWIIAGSAGPLFCRGLFRFHGVGVDRSELDRSVPLDDSDSVNAWVAINGRAVYLRSIVPAGSDGVPASPDLGRYPGLERVSVVRSSVHAVLCVPVFAEDKLVGTINLEAATPFAFDLTADVVEECAQLIGVALLEARRQISVRTMTQARGFLSRRHELEHRLVNFGTELKKWLKDVPLAAEKAADRIEELKRFVYLRNAVPVKHAGTAVSVNAVLRQATAAIEWTYKTVQPAKFAYNKDMMEFIELSSVEMSDDAAEALLFAVTQTLLNVRKYGSKASELADWEFPVQYALSLSRLGGRETLYLAIRSVCKERDIADLQPNRVFREPIEHRSGRTSLGAFLAGEVLRRCGGSAYFRVDVPESDGGILRFVTAELGVPTLG
jgi:hypothetical protein